LVCNDTMIKSCPVCLDDFYFATDNLDDVNVNRLVISSSHNAIGSHMSSHLEPPRTSSSYTPKSILTVSIYYKFIKIYFSNFII
jgi:hypothetical protein